MWGGIMCLGDCEEWEEPESGDPLATSLGLTPFGTIPEDRKLVAALTSNPEWGETVAGRTGQTVARSSCGIPFIVARFFDATAAARLRFESARIIL
jgi:hypothetical protein